MKAVSAQVVSCCVYDNTYKIILHMHGNIPYLFDFWADQFAHFLLLKSSMVGSISSPVGRWGKLKENFIIDAPLGNKLVALEWKVPSEVEWMYSAFKSLFPKLGGGEISGDVIGDDESWISAMQ